MFSLFQSLLRILVDLFCVSCDVCFSYAVLSARLILIDPVCVSGDVYYYVVCAA